MSNFLGVRLDTLSRHALWQQGLDFGHGTGHGVGMYLNVHEGPSKIIFVNINYYQYIDIVLYHSMRMNFQQTFFLKSLKIRRTRKQLRKIPFAFLRSFTLIRWFAVGIGFRTMSRHGDLKSGNVITIEPGYYLPQHYGVRIENCYEVEKINHFSALRSYISISIVKLYERVFKVFPR